ncbi:MAG: LysM peptidoglycan-binding domain-containing protein [Rhodospirillales bacterium]|nr:LysM peptidoglycan-binding domain-containing protein [Rhodospirillales bacterium]
MNTLKDKTYDYLKVPEGFRRDFYNDQGKPITIGTGYTPIVKGPKGWVVRPDAVQDFQAIGKAFSPEQIQALNDYAAEMNKPSSQRHAKRFDEAFAKLGTISLSQTDARNLYDRVHDHYQGVAERAVGKERFDQLDDGRKAVLIGLAYQSEAKMSEIGPKIANALDKKDWPAVADELGKVGNKLGDPKRYKRAALYMIDPALPGRKEIEPGDTLSTFAKRHGTTVESLIEANPELKGNPGKVRAGTPLKIPSPDAQPKPERRGELSPDSEKSLAELEDGDLKDLVTAAGDSVARDD